MRNAEKGRSDWSEGTSGSTGLSKKFVQVLLWDIMEITYNNNLKTYQEIKNNDEDNYIDKYKNQYYYTFGLQLLL